MKLLIALVLIFTLPLISGEFVVQSASDVAGAHNSCQIEQKPPDDIFKKFVHFEFPDHESTACYVQCLLTKLDMYDDNRGFLTENIVKQIESNKTNTEHSVRQVLRSCMSERPATGSESCNWVLVSFRCFMSNGQDLVLESFKL